MDCRRSASTTLIAIAAASALSAFQAAQAPSITVPRRAFVENDAVRIAGIEQTGPINVGLPTDAAGVLAGSLTTRPAFPDLYVSGLRASDRIVCVQLVSADGYYVASANVALAPAVARAGGARVILPTDNQRLRAVSAGGIGALVRVSSRTDRCAATDDVLTASWGAAPRASANPVILVAGGGRGTTPDIRRVTEDTPALCGPLPDEGRAQAAYRFVCTPRPASCQPLEEYQIDWVYVTQRREGFRIRVRRLCQ